MSVEVTRGDSPIILGLPHTGTHVPPDILARLNATGKMLTDTDWHIHRLYDGLLAGATTVRATCHRYVIDANRPPDDASLYPGQNTTGLVPLTDFDGVPIWSHPPDPAEIAARRDQFHAPYHAALRAELDRIRRIHGVAILYDCHSIRSKIPFLFDGTLPDFNIGTADGSSCAPVLQDSVARICAAASVYTQVVNGRFKGGWTTRLYGMPQDGVHAIQMELAQSLYLTSEKPPFAYDTAKSARLRPVLAEILQTLARMAPKLERLR